MKEMYQKSLQMIKLLKIKSEKEYNALLKDYFILSSESLKYISQTRDFNKIIESRRGQIGFFCYLYLCEILTRVVKKVVKLNKKSNKHLKNQVFYKMRFCDYESVALPTEL